MILKTRPFPKSVMYNSWLPSSPNEAGPLKVKFPTLVGNNSSKKFNTNSNAHAHATPQPLLQHQTRQLRRCRRQRRNMGRAVIGLLRLRNSLITSQQPTPIDVRSQAQTSCSIETQNSRIFTPRGRPSELHAINCRRCLTCSDSLSD